MTLLNIYIYIYTNSLIDVCVYLGNRTYESTSDKSIEKKFNPSPKCNSLTSSVFYLNDPIYNNM